MLFSQHRSYSRILVVIISIFSLSLLTASAALEQLILPINSSNRKVTFTFFHFSSAKTATLKEVTDNLGNSATSSNAKAAISATTNTSFSYQAGKFSFAKGTRYFIQNGIINNSATSTRTEKHTLILTDGKARHAIAYTPNVSGNELAFALKHYLTANSKFTTAIITGTGNQCGFYKNNGKYNPYYLKELKKPAKALIIK